MLYYLQYHRQTVFFKTFNTSSINNLAKYFIILSHVSCSPDPWFIHGWRFSKFYRLWGAGGVGFSVKTKKEISTVNIYRSTKMIFFIESLYNLYCTRNYTVPINFFIIKANTKFICISLPSRTGPPHKRLYNIRNINKVSPWKLF